ncbi:helix-turn-helix domain-containing protein [Candidatus Kaiserbacteria bacterium]|nr:helix-turn-helix domain-containing protein [Candidatus Kaiserbacteria bacterium]
MKKEKLIPLEQLEKKWFKDPEFKREYDALEPEFALIKSIIDKRLEAGLSQKELAEKIGTRQSAISRLEGGEGNPSFKTLRKVAEALGAQVFVTLR